MKTKILFTSVANSARSQMAEGIARDIFGSDYWIESTGSAPTQVNKHAVVVLSEMGVDISKHKSKNFADVPTQFKENIDYIITLCEGGVCPIGVSASAKRLHWPYSDPVDPKIRKQAQLLKFREVRDQLFYKIVMLKAKLRHGDNYPARELSLLF